MPHLALGTEQAALTESDEEQSTVSGAGHNVASREVENLDLATEQDPILDSGLLTEVFPSPFQWVEQSICYVHCKPLKLT